MKKLYYILVFVLLGAFVMPTEAATNWSKYKILLDPGHGGSDSGAGGYGGAPHEATLALRCGKKLRDRITGELGGTVKMTRSTDTFISLSSRREMKGSYDPYIFCSIHLNAYNKTAKGTEVLYTNTTGNSSVLANKVYGQLKTNFTAVNGTGGYSFTARGVKTASLAVCRGYASVPACLTEGLFVDNRTEWNLIKTDGSKGYLRWVHGHLMGFYDRLVMLNADIIKPNFDGTTSGGTTTTPPETETPTTPTTKITYSPTTVKLSGEYGSSKTITTEVTVTATGLSADMSVASNTSGVTVATKSGWNARTGGTIVCTLNTKYSLGASAQPYESYIAVESGSGTSKVRVQIPLEFTLTESTSSSGGTTTTPEETTPPPTSDSPQIISSVASVTLSGVVNSSTKPAKAITITAHNMETDLRFAASTSGVTVTTGDGWNTRDGGKLNITLNTAYSLGEGTYESHYVAVESGTGSNITRIQIPLSFTLLPAGSAEPTQPTDPSTPTTPDSGSNSGSTTSPSTPGVAIGSVTFHLQGGSMNIPVDNAALWENFKPDYNAWYAAHLPSDYKHPDTGAAEWKARGDQEITVVATFADKYMQDFLTNTASAWKWLGDYILSVASGLSGQSEAYWRFTTQGFFNAYELYSGASTATAHWACVGDWTTAGKPDAWKPSYIFAHKPTKENDEFLGWWNNADGNGAALTTLPTSGDVYARWKVNNSTTSVEDVTTGLRIWKTVDGVELFFTGTYDVMIYNINGMLVAGGTATDHYMANLATGMYIIRVGNDIVKFVR